MNEAEARRVFSEPETNWPYIACVEADRWMKNYALDKLHAYIAQMPPAIRTFLEQMVEYHFGSVEVDNLLTELGCYPEWLS
jgi:hypothetical protein